MQHGREQITETMCHILNGCHAYSALYIPRHDRIVDLISNHIQSILKSSIMLYKYPAVKPSMFSLGKDDSDTFSDIAANAPDDVIHQGLRDRFILEAGSTFDYNLKKVFSSILLKSRPFHS